MVKILRLRTRDNLQTLKNQLYSPAWVIAENQVNDIDYVEIYNFEGTQKVFGIFDRERSFRRNDNRLVVYFKLPLIYNLTNFNWFNNGSQNPVNYYYTN
jgi:hypothetical protein